MQGLISILVTVSLVRGDAREGFASISHKNIYRISRISSNAQKFRMTFTLDEAEMSSVLSKSSLGLTEHDMIRMPNTISCPKLTESNLRALRISYNSTRILSLRGGYTAKHGKKSKSKRKPLSLKYKIQKRIRAVSYPS
jgi:hypothetical protein